ncbi:hypothetical protein TWF694_011149 [Orbilia ellipsospora]|uniref:Uncharacterized protein n=1 Tax=Orbilia ellipsospora TaxID=2528407 RepID=A0AAV9X857_9PEZI
MITHAAVRSVTMAASRSSSSSLPRIRTLILDFDQTLTTSDTLTTLLSASPLPGASQTFTGLTNTYITEYTRHTTSFGARNTIALELTYLSSLRSIEKRSVERVEESGIFKGITKDGMSRAAQRVSIRHGGELRWLMGQVLGNGGRVCIVSVNWSRCFITEVLRRVAHSTDVDEGLDVDVSRVEVYANELLTDEAGTTTGKMDRWFHKQSKVNSGDGDGGDGIVDVEVRPRSGVEGTKEEEEHGIWTADDKLRVLDFIFQQEEEGYDTAVATSVDTRQDASSNIVPTVVKTQTLMLEDGENSKKGRDKGWNVYVGDSATDLAALLFHRRIDVGFVMGGEGENKGLLEICQRHGVRVRQKRRVREGQGQGQACQRGTADSGDTEGPGETTLIIPTLTGDRGIGPLCRVERWTELVECLQRPDLWQ